jgi:PAS domain S-box-containing protein
MSKNEKNIIYLWIINIINLSARPLLLFLFFININFVWSQDGHIRFRHLTTQQGLSQSEILSSEQDALGFLWFGTADGLNKYDGYNFRVYRHDPDNSSSISDNEVMALMDDLAGGMWIGTAGGIDVLNMETEQWAHFNSDNSNTKTLSDNYITDLYQDSQARIWISTANGLNQYNAVDSSFTRYYPGDGLVNNMIWSVLETADGEMLLGSDQGIFKLDEASNVFEQVIGETIVETAEMSCKITSLIQDRQEYIWAGTDRGIFRFDRNLKNRKHFTTKNGLSNAFTNTLYENTKGNIWIGTADGLNRYVPATESFMSCRYDQVDKFSLNNNSIHTITEDRDGVIWFGTAGGINILDPQSFQFNPVTIHAVTGNELVNNKVWTINEDTDDLLWLGTAGGLHLYDAPQRRIVKTFNATGKEGLSNDVIRCLEKDLQNNLWVGTDSGLFYYRKDINTFESFQHIRTGSTTINSQAVNSLALGNDYLWVGTANGLTKVDLISRQHSRIYFSNKGIQSFSLNAIQHVLNDGPHLWIATQGGLLKYNKENGSYVIHQHGNDPGSISHNFVRTIYKNNSDVLWLGTSRGLNKYDDATGVFKSYSTKDGLANEVVNAIEQHGESLWMSTNKGLTKFDIRDESFVNYDVLDGLQGNEFNANASYINGNGQLIFGGSQGLNIFSPADISDRDFVLKIVLTGFDVFNKPVAVSAHSPLRKSILMTDTIYLNNSDNSFTFHFSTLDFTSSRQNRYRYKLEGFEEFWNETENRRSASYTNLSGGSYKFTVEAGCNTGKWVANRSVMIIIQSPFWKQIWFYVCLTLLLVGFGIGVIRLRTYKMRRRNTMLRETIEDRTKTLNESKQALAKSESLFRGIYEHSPIGIAYLEQRSAEEINQKIIKCNEQFCNILGYSGHEIRFKSMIDLTYPEDVEEDLKANLVVAKDKDRKFYRRKKRLVHKSGMIIYAAVAVTMVRDKKGNGQYQIIMIDDITKEHTAMEKLRKAQSQLIQSDKMASLGQLTAGVAHEINNPINFIATGIHALDKNMKKFLEINEQYDKIDHHNNIDALLGDIHQTKQEAGYSEIRQDIEDMIGAIKEGADRAAKIVDGLQTFTYTSDTEYVIDDVHEGIDSTLLLLSNKLKPEILVDKRFYATNCNISCLPGQLNQVFMNIITNAIQAIEAKENPKIIIETASTDKMVIVKVSDNGMGISDELQERIFEPFYTTKPVGQGTGLGLAISYGIIEKHGGEIKVESAYGRTTFIICLPLREG